MRPGFQWGGSPLLAILACMCGMRPLQASPLSASLEVDLGQTNLQGAQPLVAAGLPGRGQAVFLDRDGEGRFRLGWMDSEQGVVYSGPLPGGGTGRHRIAAAMPSISGPEAGDLGRQVLVTWDGRIAIRYLAPAGTAGGAGPVRFGVNATAAALLMPSFEGVLDHSSTPELVETVRQAMRWQCWVGRTSSRMAFPGGSIGMEIAIPADVSAAGYPLATSGRQGKGDFVYLRVVDPYRVRLGFDHWGVGGALSDPVPAKPGSRHALTVEMDSMAGQAGCGTGRVRVFLDGRSGLDCQSRCWPATADEIWIGCNPIGGSTTSELYPAWIGGVVPAALR